MHTKLWVIRGSRYRDMAQKDLGVSKNVYGVTSWMWDNEARNTINLAVMPDNGLMLK